jgi:hypothetical protein
LVTRTSDQWKHLGLVDEGDETVMVVGDDYRCGSATTSSCGAALLQENGRKRIGDWQPVL